jgi:hypothetical protein
MVLTRSSFLALLVVAIIAFALTQAKNGYESPKDTSSWKPPNEKYDGKDDSYDDEYKDGKYKHCVHKCIMKCKKYCCKKYDCKKNGDYEKYKDGDGKTARKARVRAMAII